VNSVAPVKREMHVVHSRGDKVFRGIVSAGALTSLVLLGLIGAFLLARGIEVFSTSGFKFLALTGLQAVKTASFQTIFRLGR
jgi:ABC-type phosphate transport system permease subunit